MTPNSCTSTVARDGTQCTSERATDASVGEVSSDICQMQNWPCIIGGAATRVGFPSWLVAVTRCWWWIGGRMVGVVGRRLFLVCGVTWSLPTHITVPAGLAAVGCRLSRSWDVAR